jgi:hypothetical protein
MYINNVEVRKVTLHLVKLVDSIGFYIVCVGFTSLFNLLFNLYKGWPF